MNYLKLCILSVILISSSLYAKTESHILSASSSTSSLVFYKNNGENYKANFNLYVGYDYAISNGLQLGASFGSSFYSNINSWSLAIGPGYNFNKEDLANSYFAETKIGVVSTHFYSNTSSDTFMILHGAKRFNLMDHVSYVPGISINKTFGSNSPDPTFTFELFRLSIIF